MSFFQNLTTKKHSFIFLSSFHIGIPLAICQSHKSHTWDSLKLELLEKFSTISIYDVLNLNNDPLNYYHENLKLSYIETNFPLGNPIALHHNQFLSYFNLPKYFKKIGFNTFDTYFDNLIWICPSGVVLIMGKFSFDEDIITIDQWNDDIVQEHYEELTYIFIGIAKIILDCIPKKLLNSSFSRQININKNQKAISYFNKHDLFSIVDLEKFFYQNKEAQSLFNDILIDVYYIEFKNTEVEKKMISVGYTYSSISSTNPSYAYYLCIAYSLFPGFVWITRHLGEQSTILYESITGNSRLYDSLFTEIKIFRIFCLKFINESSPICIRLTKSYMELLEEFWKIERLHDLNEQVNEQLSTIETILEWIDENKREFRNFKIGIAATFIALISLASVVAQLISTIDFTNQIVNSSALRSWYIFSGFLVGILFSIIVYILPMSKWKNRRIMSKKRTKK